MLATNCAEKCSKTLEIHRFFDDADQKSYKFIWFFNTIDRECSVKLCVLSKNLFSIEEAMLFQIEKLFVLGGRTKN